MARNARPEIAVGLLVLGAAALLGWMALKVGSFRGFGEQIEVQARMADAAGLTVGAVVKIAGVDVGRVDRLWLDQGQARLALSVDAAAGLRQDGRLRVRARSVLGEKYVELLPGSAEAPLARDGDELQALPPPMEIDLLVDRLGPLMEGLPMEELGRSLSLLGQAIEKDPQRVERILVDLETMARNGALASEDLPATLDEARATLREVRRAVAEARPALARAEAALANLEAGTQDLGRSRAEVDALLTETRGAVADGRRLLSRLEENGDRLERVLRNAEEIDKWELRRLLREEGILVRLKKSEVEEPE